MKRIIIKKTTTATVIATELKEGLYRKEMETVCQTDKGIEPDKEILRHRLSRLTDSFSQCEI